MKNKKKYFQDRKVKFSNRKIIRVTTVPISLKILLKDQLKYINQFFDVIAVSSSGEELYKVELSQGVRVKTIEMSRNITPIKDLISLSKMIFFC